MAAAFARNKRLGKFNEKYKQYGRQLGKGASGIVYKVQLLADTDQVFAVKITKRSEYHPFKTAGRVYSAVPSLVECLEVFKCKNKFY